MSVFEPSESTLDPGAVRFPVVMRGYDRHDVDAMLQELFRQLAHERLRAEEAMQAVLQLEGEIASRQHTPSFADLGVEAGRVFEQAGTAAEKLVAEASEQARAIEADAEAKADDMLKAAQGRATELEQVARDALADAEDERARVSAEAAELADEAKAKAGEEAQRLVAAAIADAEVARQRAERQREHIDAETKRLRTLRQFTIDQLTQMQVQLGDALGEIVAELGLGGTDELAGVHGPVSPDSVAGTQPADPPGVAAAQHVPSGQEALSGQQAWFGQEELPGQKTLPGPDAANESATNESAAEASTAETAVARTVPVPPVPPVRPVQSADNGELDAGKPQGNRDRP